MTRGQLHAKAVAYEASRSPRHYQDLCQSDLQEFWTQVDTLRARREARRLRRDFKIDQAGPPQVLP